MKPLVALVSHDDNESSAVLRSTLTNEEFEVASVRLASVESDLPAVVAAGASALVVQASMDDPLLDAFVAAKAKVGRLATLPALLVAPGGASPSGDDRIPVGFFDVVTKPASANDVARLIQCELAPSIGAVRQLAVEAFYPTKLLRAFLSGRRNGRLELQATGVRISFRAGHVVDVRGATQFGFSALVRALATAHGQFSVSFTDLTDEEGRLCDANEYSLSVVPRVERFERVALTAPSLGTTYSAVLAGTAAKINALPLEIKRVFQLFDGVRTLGQVIWDSHLEEATSLMVALKLMRLSLIERDETLTTSGPAYLEPSPSPLPFREDAGGKRQHDEWADTTPALVIVPPTPHPLPNTPTPVPPFQSSANLALSHGSQTQALVAAAAESQVGNRTEDDSAAGLGAVKSRSWPLWPLALAMAAAAGAWWLWSREPQTKADASVGAEKVADAQGMRPPEPAADAADDGANDVEGTATTIEASPAVDSLTMAERFYENDRNQEAATLLEQLTTQEPDNATAWLLLAKVRYDLRDDAGAEQAAQTVLQIAPQNAEVHMLLASIAADQGDPERAQRELKAYLAIEPGGRFAKEAKILLESE